MSCRPQISIAKTYLAFIIKAMCILVPQISAFITKASQYNCLITYIQALQLTALCIIYILFLLPFSKPIKHSYITVTSVCMQVKQAISKGICVLCIAT